MAVPGLQEWCLYNMSVCCEHTSSARLISIVVFATPEKTHLSAVPPAASTRSNSPMETMSKPAPIFANISMNSYS